MRRSNLCDYSDTYMHAHIHGTITVQNFGAAEPSAGWPLDT